MARSAANACGVIVLCEHYMCWGLALWLIRSPIAQRELGASHARNCARPRALPPSPPYAHRAGALVATAVQAATVIVNPHNGMTFFYNEPHKTVPRDAEVASLETAVDCICSDADPRDESLLVTTNCYHQALYGNCQAEFMSGALEELVEADGGFFCLR